MAYDNCEPLVVYLLEITVEREDRHEAGDGPMDRVVGAAMFGNEDGEHVGTAYFYQERMPLPALDGSDPPTMFITDAHYVFPSGTITVTGANPVMDLPSLPQQTHAYTIAGGTGVFAGARGELVAETLEDGRRRQMLNLDCD
ncbi:MAG: hypothetical protein AAFX92_11145 [Pseudomonadota bacterium]